LLPPSSEQEVIFPKPDKIVQFSLYKPCSWGGKEWNKYARLSSLHQCYTGPQVCLAIYLYKQVKMLQSQNIFLHAPDKCLTYDITKSDQHYVWQQAKGLWHMLETWTLHTSHIVMSLQPNCIVIELYQKNIAYHQQRWCMIRHLCQLNGTTYITDYGHIPLCMPWCYIRLPCIQYCLIPRITEMYTVTTTYMVMCYQMTHLSFFLS
jgi:hypothetical protein